MHQLISLILIFFQILVKWVICFIEAISTNNGTLINIVYPKISKTISQVSQISHICRPIFYTLYLYIFISIHVHANIQNYDWN